MVKSSPSCKRRPPCKTNRGMSDEAGDTAALTCSLTPCPGVPGIPEKTPVSNFQEGDRVWVQNRTDQRGVHPKLDRLW